MCCNLSNGTFNKVYIVSLKTCSFSIVQSPVSTVRDDRSYIVPHTMGIPEINSVLYGVYPQVCISSISSKVAERCKSNAVNVVFDALQIIFYTRDALLKSADVVTCDSATLCHEIATASATKIVQIVTLITHSVHVNNVRIVLDGKPPTMKTVRNSIVKRGLEYIYTPGLSTSIPVRLTRPGVRSSTAHASNASNYGTESPTTCQKHIAIILEILKNHMLRMNYEITDLHRGEAEHEIVLSRDVSFPTIIVSTDTDLYHLVHGFVPLAPTDYLFQLKLEKHIIDLSDIQHTKRIPALFKKSHLLFTIVLMMRGSDYTFPLITKQELVMLIDELLYVDLCPITYETLQCPIGDIQKNVVREIETIQTVITPYIAKQTAIRSQLNAYKYGQADDPEESLVNANELHNSRTSTDTTEQDDVYCVHDVQVVMESVVKIICYKYLKTNLERSMRVSQEKWKAVKAVPNALDVVYKRRAVCKTMASTKHSTPANAKRERQQPVQVTKPNMMQLSSIDNDNYSFYVQSVAWSVNYSLLGPYYTHFQTEYPVKFVDNIMRVKFFRIATKCLSTNNNNRKGGLFDMFLNDFSMHVLANARSKM